MLKYCLALFIIILCFAKELFAATLIIPEIDLRSGTGGIRKNQHTLQRTEITRSEIEKTPEINLSELLKNEQSIVRLTMSDDTNQTALSIRGFGENAAANSLILVDGFPLTNPSLFAPNFNMITLSDIERIEILQGSEGVLWGDQAVGGVVNIITRHPEKFYSTIYLEGGSYNKSFLSILVGDKFKNTIFVKSFGFYHRNDHYRQHNRQQNENFAAQMGLDYARGQVYFNFQYANDMSQFPGPLTENQFIIDPRQATNFGNSATYNTMILQLLNKHEINPEWMFETRLMHYQKNGEGVFRGPFTRDESVNSFHPKLIGKLANNKITLGYYWQNSRFALSNVSTQPKAKAYQNDLYAQIHIPVIPRVEVIFGGRFAQQNNVAEKNINQAISSINRVFVTEQGISFAVNPEWQFFLRRNENFRFPKPFEAVFNPPFVSSLQAQTGVSYETGVTWQTERNKTQISLYRLQLHNEIAFDPTATPKSPFGIYENFDRTLRYGITFTENFHLTPKATIGSQINYVDARFASGQFSGHFIPDVPAVNANADIAYEFLPCWQTKYIVLYTGSRFASHDNANVSKKLPGYWLNTIALQYLRQAFTVSFEIANLFNQRYATSSSFDSFTHTNSYYPGEGRNYLLTFKANF